MTLMVGFVVQGHIYVFSCTKNKMYKELNNIIEKIMFMNLFKLCFADSAVDM